MSQLRPVTCVLDPTQPAIQTQTQHTPVGSVQPAQPSGHRTHAHEHVRIQNGAVVEIAGTAEVTCAGASSA